MKFLMYGVKPQEKEYIAEWAKETGIEVTPVEDSLHKDTVDLAKGYDGIVLMQTEPLGGPEVYKKLADFGIKQISLRTAGYDMVDLKAAKENNLTVTRVSSYSPRAIAEMGVTQAMYLLRRIGEFRAREAEGDFRWSADLMAKEIYNCTVGVIGLGRIGGATAQIYKALGAKVLAYDVGYEPAMEPYVEYVDKDTIIKEADIISLHTPLLKTTANMIDEVALKKMKKSAILINMARGGLIDTDALIKALKDGEIAGAGLDTLADETTYFSHQVDPKDVPDDYKELAAMPNVLVTPHVAYFTETAVRNMVRISLNDVLTIVNGGKSRNEIR